MDVVLIPRACSRYDYNMTIPMYKTSCKWRARLCDYSNDIGICGPNALASSLHSCSCLRNPMLALRDAAGVKARGSAPRDFSPGASSKASAGKTHHHPIGARCHDRHIEICSPSIWNTSWPISDSCCCKSSRNLSAQAGLAKQFSDSQLMDVSNPGSRSM